MDERMAHAPAGTVFEVDKSYLGMPVLRVSSAHILDQAARKQADRAQFYDAPAGERSMAKAVTAFNTIYGTSLTEVQGWQFMALLKMVRASQGAYRADNFIDQVSYGAFAGEAACNR